MKKIIKLTENDLNKMLSLIIEEIDFDAYDDADFYDAFLVLFKDWISKKLGDDIKKYPISFLLRKYGNEFERNMGIGDEDDEEEEDDYYNEYDRYRIVRAAQNLITQGKHTLPSLNTNTKFTERYKKMLPTVVEHLNLPDYVRIEFEEENPNKVDVKLTVDFNKLITTPDATRIRKHNIQDELKKFLKNFMGVEFGNPTYGQVELDVIHGIDFIGRDEWVKNILNKKIKKDIKQLPNANMLHSIRFYPDNDGHSEIKLIFKDDYHVRNKYSEKRKLRDDVTEYLKSQGYNDLVRVDF